MIAACALMNLTAQAAYPELCLGLGRPISAVRINIRRRIGFVQKPIEFLTVMHARVGHVILPDQLVPGIGIHVVLVSIETLAVLLGPARILVFLPVFRRIFLPGPGRLAESSFSSRLLRCLGTGTSVSRNNQSVVPSGMLSSMPSRTNRVNDRRSRT